MWFGHPTSKYVMQVTNMKLLLCLFAVMAASMANDVAVNDILKKANQQFTSRMFTEVVKQHPKESVVLSAFSVLTPLAQLSLASEGDTHDKLLKVIGMPNDNSTKEVFKGVTHDVRSIKGVELKMANKVYIPTGFELNEKYAAVAKDVFESEVQNVDFTKSTEAASIINSWVEDHTNKRIKDLVSPNNFGNDTKAVLVNAIYFKGSWKEKFNKAQTKDKPFHVSADKTVDIPFMHKASFFLYGYSKELQAQLLQLPYEGDEASFLVVLPNEVDGLAALQEKLKDPNVLEKAVQEMTSREVVVHLPKFKIETQTNLQEALKNMDLKQIFMPGLARLTGLVKGFSNLHVTAATQKAFIEVNEDGAEAAAANSIHISYHSPKLDFIADRPFYFELRHNDKPLFSGVMRSTNAPK